MHWKIWSTFYRTSSHQEDCYRCFYCFTDMRENRWEQSQCRLLFSFLCPIVWEWFCCYHVPGLWPMKASPKKPEPSKPSWWMEVFTNRRLFLRGKEPRWRQRSSRRLPSSSGCLPALPARGAKGRRERCSADGGGAFATERVGESVAWAMEIMMVRTQHQTTIVNM